MFKWEVPYINPYAVAPYTNPMGTWMDTDIKICDGDTNLYTDYTISWIKETFGDNKEGEKEMPPKNKYDLTLTIEKFDLKGLFTPVKIIVNFPATIVFWSDKTKTVVKCAENDSVDIYDAFTAALAKKIFGSNHRIQKMIEKVVEDKSEIPEIQNFDICETLADAAKKIREAFGGESNEDK